MDENRISEKKLFTILAIDLFSMTGLIFPSVIVRFGGNGGLFGLALASALAVLSACFFLRITKNGEWSFVNAVRQLPQGFRSVITGVYCIRFFLHGVFLMNVFVTLIQETLLPYHNRGWILLPFLIVVFLAAGKGISVRGSMLEVLMPYIFLPLLLVLVLALFEVDYGSLPAYVMGETAGNNGISSYGMFLFFQPIEFLLFLTPFRKTEKQKKGKAVCWALLFVILINILLYLATVGMFGTKRTAEKLWSALYIMQSVRLPGHFIERLDILFLVFYIFSIFALFSGYLFYSENLLSVHGEGWKKKMYPLLYLAATFFVVNGMGDVEQAYEQFLSYKMRYDVVLAFGIPLLVRFLGVWKNGKKKDIVTICLCCMAGMFLSGCQNKVDIEDRNYVMSLSVEKGEEEKIKVTYETADLAVNIADTGGRTQGKSTVYTGNSFDDVEKKEENSDEKRVDYGHLKAILFQKSMLEDPVLWQQMVKELEEKRGLAGTILVFFAEEEPEEYMKLTEKRGISLGEYLETMMANHKTEELEEYTLSDLLREEAEEIHRRKVPVLSIQGEKIYVTKKNWEKVSPISSQVLRFHIRANSDSEEDQAFKLKIKDRILPYLQKLFAECDTKAESVKIAQDNLQNIEGEVKKACKEEKETMKVKVYLCQEAFPIKEYGSVLVTSGIYDALRIDLGKGEGANWWCMMYPSLCMIDGVTEETGEETKEDTKIHIKWKIPALFDQFFGELLP